MSPSPSKPLMISLLDKNDTELLELVTHTFKEGLKNNVDIPGIPSLRSKMLNLVEVALFCYNNHKEHEDNHYQRAREAHLQFQSKITTPVTSRNIENSASSTSSEQNVPNQNDTTGSSSSSEGNIDTSTTIVPPPIPSVNGNLPSELIQERRNTRATSIDETEASPSTNSHTERVNKRHSKSMDETTSPTRKKKKTSSPKRGPTPLISPQKEAFSVGDSVFSCWWANGPHHSQGYFACKITKVHGGGKKYDIVYDTDGKKGQRVPRSLIKRTKP